MWAVEWSSRCRNVESRAVRRSGFATAAILAGIRAGGDAKDVVDRASRRPPAARPGSRGRSGSQGSRPRRRRRRALSAPLRRPCVPPRPEGVARRANWSSISSGERPSGILSGYLTALMVSVALQIRRQRPCFEAKRVPGVVASRSAPAWAPIVLRCDRMITAIGGLVLVVLLAGRRLAAWVSERQTPLLEPANLGRAAAF